MKTLNASFNGLMLTFSPWVTPSGMAEILYQGRRREEFLSMEEWRQFAPQCASLFPCTFCAENVIAFRTLPAKNVVQTCRCTTLCFVVGKPFQTQDQWNWVASR